MRDIESILQQSGVIAVVGLSDKPDRPSYGVAAYMQQKGYRVIPVNPLLKQPVLGETPYPDVASAPEQVDIVDVFRRAEETPAAVGQAIAAGASAVWLQLGIVNEEAAAMARAAGLDVVMDKCIKVEHQRLESEGKLAARRGPPE
ncbi:MAG: CoA-binding protein [Chloroflexota bacterium]|nr:CoA-binding protein [Chloroflexota bacterium]